MWPSFMYSIITELYHSWQWQAVFIRLLFSHRMVWGLYGDGWIQCPQYSVFTEHNIITVKPVLSSHTVPQWGKKVAALRQVAAYQMWISVQNLSKNIRFGCIKTCWLLNRGGHLLRFDCIWPTQRMLYLLHMYMLFLLFIYYAHSCHTYYSIIVPLNPLIIKQIRNCIFLKLWYT